MANSMTSAFKEATARKADQEFDRAASEFAKRVGPVSPDELRVNLDHEQDPHAQVLKETLSRRRRRKLN